MRFCPLAPRVVILSRGIPGGMGVMQDQVRCVELGRLAVPGMRIKVRWFPAGANHQQVWRARSSVLSFSRVVGEPVQHRNTAKRSSSFHPAGPLTFWPQSAVWESRRNHSEVLTVSAYFDTSFRSATAHSNPDGIRIDDFSMLEMMQTLHDEVRTPGTATHELVGAIGSILRIKLSRLMSQQARNPSVLKPCCSVDVAILHALISHTGGRLPTTAELAEKLKLDRRDLLRLCKKTTGMPPSRYIEETKLERAKMLLATSGLTMKQIAYEAGYSTASHFSTRFGQFTGLTPSAFRSKARRQDGLHPQDHQICTDERRTSHDRYLQRMRAPDIRGSASEANSEPAESRPGTNK
jgi:AraC family transcriptional regulator